MKRQAWRAVLMLILALAALSLVPATTSALPKIPAQSFQSAITCNCHRTQYEQWEPSMHAKALFDPVYVTKKTEADKATDGALGLFCDTCHTPIGTMSGQTTAKKLSLQSREGVTCDFCHQAVGTAKTPPGEASMELVADGTKRAQFSDAVAPGHKTAYSAFHESAEFCGTCHNLVHPTTGVKLDDTYDQWKAGPYSGAGIVCQDCHMTPGPGEPPQPGRAGSMGPIRDRIYLMTFSGANVPLGDPERARVVLSRAATIDLDVPEVLAKGEQGTVDVRVTNTGAGHAIPAGVAEIRQMWLEVNAVNPDGTTRLLGKRQFGTVFRDANGNYPVQLWDAVAIQSEDRIPPKGSVDVSYPLPMDSETSVTVEAVLNYRSFPDDLARKAGVANPVTVMARSQATVYASESLLRQAERAARRSEQSWLFSDGGATAAAIAVASLLLVALALFFVVRRRRRKRSAGSGGPLGDL